MFFCEVGDWFYLVILLILSSKFLLMLTKYVFISSNRSNYVITVHYRFPPFFILPSYHVAAVSFIWEVTEGVASSVHEDWERRRKVRKEMPRLNNFESVWENYAYTFQNIGNYLFCWSVLTEESDWMDRNWLYQFSSPYKYKRIDCSRKLLREKKGKMQKRI